MRNFKNFLGILAFVAVALTGFCSCSKDDEPKNQTLETPAYETDAAKYDLQSNALDINTLELTASGNFIIELDYNGYYDSKPAKSAKNDEVRIGRIISANSMFRNSARTTRSDFDYFENIISGRYTKTGENTYELEGYGTLTVIKDGDNAVRLVITRNGQTVDAVGTRVDEYAQSEMTNNLCRTWIPSKFGFSMVVGKKTLFDDYRSVNDLKTLVQNYVKTMLKYFDPDEIDEDDINYESLLKELQEDIPEKVIFTRSGTYMVIYKDGTLAISTWKWVNEKKGQLRYSWDYDDEYDSEESGVVNVSFPDGLEIKEAFVNDDDFDYDQPLLRGMVRWGFSEQK